MKRLTTLAGLAAAFLVMQPAARADGIRTGNCVWVGGLLSCTEKWQRWDPEPPRPPTEQELAEARERERQWQARCRPVVRHDEFGVPRYAYAAPGCEYGRLN